MAGGTVAKTPHFVLHRAPLDAQPAPAGREASRPRALFVVHDEPWMGAVVPKRWARRAVTRNGIKRQIYAVSASFEPQLPCAAHVVRLRTEFARAQFPSAWSEPLKQAVRAELVQLFERVAGRQAVTPAKAGAQGAQEEGPQAVTPAKAGAQGAQEEGPQAVTPAKAGAQGSPEKEALDSRLRGNDQGGRLRGNDGTGGAA